MLVVHRLAGILLQMQALDADLDVFELPLAVRTDGNDDLALADDRVLVLRDLVALRQVRIEIVLPVEDRAIVDLCLQAQAGAHGLLDAFLVDDRKHARHCGIDERNIGIRLRSELGRRTGEQLRIAQHLRMDLHADDDLPVAGGAWNEAFRIRSADVDDAHVMLFFEA